MNNSRIFIILISAITCILPASSQVIGDSIAAIVNNWEKGNEAKYYNYAFRLSIQGGDTIVERESPVTITTLRLAEILPDDDKIFVMTTEYPDSTEMIKNLSEQSMFTVTTDDGTEEEDTSKTAENKAEIYNQFLKLMEKPITVLTNFAGEVKDIYDYTSLRADLDSCFERVEGNLVDADLPDGTKLAILLNLQRLWDGMVSKEALINNCDILRYYGYTYPLGSTIEHTKESLLSGDHEVDAIVNFSCMPVETEDGAELIEISNVTTYDSDQVMDYVMSLFIDEEEQKAHSLKDPDRPYISMIVSELFLFEPKLGTLVEYSREKRTTTPEKTIIDYTVCELE